MCEERAITHLADSVSAGPTTTTSAELPTRDQPPNACEIEPTTAHDEDSDHATPTLSKKAQKRLLKAERLAAIKLERRAREKAAKKAKKKEQAAKRAAGEDDASTSQTAWTRPSKRARLQSEGTTSKQPFGARIVVDLGFDDLMNDKEIISLCSQLAYTYAANRRADQPFKELLFTSLGARTFTRLEGLSNASYKRWTGTEWWKEGYCRLWAHDGDHEPSGENGGTKGNDTSEHHPTMFRSTAPRCHKSEVVYLTADSPEELSELKEDETYIIGGICDHNRYKNLCEKKAKTDGIRSARLPIGTYLAELPTRKVLTVNQVFDILVKWIQTRDWEEALYSVVPKRKFQGATRATEDIKGPLDDEREGEREGSGEEIEAPSDSVFSTKTPDSIEEQQM